VQLRAWEAELPNLKLCIQGLSETRTLLQAEIKRVLDAMTRLKQEAERGDTAWPAAAAATGFSFFQVQVQAVGSAHLRSFPFAPHLAEGSGVEWLLAQLLLPPPRPPHSSSRAALPVCRGWRVCWGGRGDQLMTTLYLSIAIDLDASGNGAGRAGDEAAA
jgi:hypothetical protein